MKKRLFSMLLAGAMMTGLMAGCGSTTEDTAAAPSTDTAATDSAADSTAASGDVSVQVILKTLASEYWGYVQAGCVQAGEDLGVKVDVVGAASETAYDEQMNIIETSLGSNAYNALVIAPLQADMVATKIASTELPIIALDTKIESDKVLSFVGTGNEEAAAKGGEAAVAAAKAAGWTDLKAISISGVQGDSTATARLTGYQKGVEAAGGTFLADETQYADAVADKAVTSMEAIMQNHPEGIAMILCNNDDMAMAASRAAKGNAAYEKTIFVGFDGISSACTAIINGEETMSVAQDAYGMGYKAVAAAVDAVGGKTLEAFIDSGCEIVTPDNAQARLDKLNSYTN